MKLTKKKPNKIKVHVFTHIYEEIVTTYNQIKFSFTLIKNNQRIFNHLPCYDAQCD